MNTIESVNRSIQHRAHRVLDELHIMECWQAIGAEPHLVGSMAMGLMVKHCDIDVHIYSPQVSFTYSSEAIALLSEHHVLKRVEYVDLLHTEEQCIEWHVWYEDSEQTLWQIDMIHMVKGSKYDGFFEQVAQRMKESLTSETRAAILMLKYETPDDLHIAGIEYYRAVLSDGVRTFPELLKWRQYHPMDGIETWMP